MPRNPRPGSTAPLPSTPGASSPDKRQSEADSKASNDVQSKSAADLEKPLRKLLLFSRSRPARQGNGSKSATTPKNTTTPAQPLVPTKTAVPHAHQATTFTAGTLGMWRVSMPTAVGPLGGVQTSGRARPVRPVTEKESSRVRETKAEENPAPVAKSAASQAEASAASSRNARVNELTKVAEASVLANAEKMPVREVATSSREQLPAKVPEKTRPASTTAATALDKAQAESPAPNASISAGIVAGAAKQGKVEAKAMVPAHRTAPKAQTNPSNARTETNGKPKIAPPSLGMRFKRRPQPCRASCQ